MSILHIIPEAVFSNTYHGAYKDIRFRIQWFDDYVKDCQLIRLKSDEPALADQLQAEFCPTHLLVEYTHFPRLLKRFRKLNPDLWIGVRAINIEPLQHLHNVGWFPAHGPLWVLYGMGRLLCQDIVCKQMADVVLSINEAETRIYWDRLPGRANVKWLPYRCPDHLVPRNPQPYDQRRVIACMPTSKKNRKSLDLVTRFQQFATEMKRQGSQDRFVITGDVRGWGLPECSDVTKTGFVDDLAGFMGRCKAICMLSPLGYGFKTTIADALAAGASVLIHPTLLKRCPTEIQSFLISCDSRGVRNQFDSLLQQLQTPPRGMELHERLKGIANDEMCRFVEGKPA